MKQKLTITVDGELVPKAKRYARSQGVSLSALIETELRSLVSGEAQSFASRWRGGFVPAEREDPRYEALAKKYL
jgi:post-segregation antitoxin (ccd killing protein)